MVKQLSHCRTVSSEKRESQAWDTAKKALETTGIYRNNRNLQENRNTVMFFCRTVALFFHKWISRHSDKKCVGYCSFWPRIEQKCIFLRKQKAVNTCNYVSTAFFAAFSYFKNTHFFVVEATRIELVSENKSTQLSTSVVYLHWFPFKTAGKQAAKKGSSNPILRCEQAAGTFTTAMMPQRRPWYSYGRQ